MKIALFAYSRQGCKTARRVLEHFKGNEIQVFTILERVFNSLVTSYGDDAAPIIDTILSGFISSK